MGEAYGPAGMLDREQPVQRVVSGKAIVEIFLQADDLVRAEYAGPFGQGHEYWDVVRVGCTDLRGGRPRGDGSHLLLDSAHNTSLIAGERAEPRRAPRLP
jgi:hypothetical protein